MKRNTTSIGNAIQSVLKNIDAYDSYVKLYIVQNWKNIMPSPISEICKPLTFEQEVLVVEANSEAWAKELQRFKNQIIKQLNQKFSQLQLKEIKII